MHPGRTRSRSSRANRRYDRLDTATGTLAFTDVDLSDTHTVSKSAPTFAWSGGSLSTMQQMDWASASTLALTKTDSTGTGTGSIGFTYSAVDKTFDFLAAERRSPSLTM